MKKSIFRFGKPYIWAFILAYVVYGCYYFVSDDTPPEWQGDPTAQDQAAVAAAGGPGAAVYNAKCAVCHQMDGQGLPGVYPALVGSDFATGDPGLPDVLRKLRGLQELQHPHSLQPSVSRPRGHQACSSNGSAGR